MVLSVYGKTTLKFAFFHETVLTAWYSALWHICWTISNHIIVYCVWFISFFLFCSKDQLSCLFSFCMNIRILPENDSWFFRFLVNLTKKWNEPDTSHLQTIEITFNVLCLRSLLLIHIGVKIKSFGSFLLLKFGIFFCHLLPWHFVMWHGSHNWGYVFNWHSNLFHWISFPKN